MSLLILYVIMGFGLYCDTLILFIKNKIPSNPKALFSHYYLVLVL